MTPVLAFLIAVPLWLSAVFFMIISGLNFALHFHAWHSRRPNMYWADPEARMRSIADTIITCCYLYYSGTFRAVKAYLSINFHHDHHRLLFHTWPSFLPFFLLFLLAPVQAPLAAV